MFTTGRGCRIFVGPCFACGLDIFMGQVWRYTFMKAGCDGPRGSTPTVVLFRQRASGFRFSENTDAFTFLIGQDGTHLEVEIKESTCVLSIFIKRGFQFRNADDFDLPSPRTYSREHSTTESCAICLEGLAEGDSVQSIPGCSHMFHSACLEGWLNGYGESCPYCRGSIPLLA